MGYGGPSPHSRLLPRTWLRTRPFSEPVAAAAGTLRKGSPGWYLKPLDKLPKWLSRHVIRWPLDGARNVLDADEIVTFRDDPPPPGKSPFVRGAEPTPESIAVSPYDPTWPDQFREIAERIRNALGMRALSVDHCGSTSVPDLHAKPVIDIDLTVADSGQESAWLPQLQRAGFKLTVREPWWYEHRCLTLDAPRCNLHVWSPSCPEAYRHRLFRDWLRESIEDKELYRGIKLAAAEESNSRGETISSYNERKAEVLRQIYQRAFAAAGLLDR